MKKEFTDIYHKIYNENEIYYIEKSANHNTLIILYMAGIMMLGALVFIKSLFITLPLVCIYLLCFFKKNKNIEQENKLAYKEKLILPLIKEIFEDVEYKPNESIQLNEYLKAEYQDRAIEYLSKFSSNDHIIFPMKIDGVNIGNLDIYDVKLQKSSKKNNIIFEGLTGTISLSKNIQNKIKLISNWNSFTNNNVVSMDVPEFDNYFKILSENKILAMRIFTPDIIEKIIKIFKSNKHVFNISIINDKLYVRVYCVSAFETTITLGMEKHEILKQSFIALEVIQEIVGLIYKTIDNIEI